MYGRVVVDQPLAVASSGTAECVEVDQPHANGSIFSPDSAEWLELGDRQMDGPTPTQIVTGKEVERPTFMDEYEQPTSPDSPESEKVFAIDPSVWDSFQHARGNVACVRSFFEWNFDGDPHKPNDCCVWPLLAPVSLAFGLISIVFSALLTALSYLLCCGSAFHERNDPVYLTKEKRQQPLPEWHERALILTSTGVRGAGSEAGLTWSGVGSVSVTHTGSVHTKRWHRPDYEQSDHLESSIIPDPNRQSAELNLDLQCGVDVGFCSACAYFVCYQQVVQGYSVIEIRSRALKVIKEWTIADDNGPYDTAKAQLHTISAPAQIIRVHALAADSEHVLSAVRKYQYA